MTALKKILDFFRGAPIAADVGEERRGHYRYRVPPDFPLRVEFPDPPLAGLQTQIKDLSLGGLSLSLSGPKDRFRLSQIFSLKITHHQSKVEMRGEVIRWDGKTLVLKFPEDERGKMDRLLPLFPKLLGTSLKEHPLPQDKHLMPCRWFHGQCYTDLFVWWNPQQKSFTMDHFLFLYENCVVEWGRSQKLRTGLIIREKYSSAHHSFHLEPPLILYQNQPAPDSVGGAVDILDASSIPSDVKEALLAVLGASYKEEGIRRFGEILHQKRKWPRYPVLPQEELRVLFSVPELSARLEDEKTRKSSPTLRVANISRGGVGVLLDHQKDAAKYPAGSEVIVTLERGERRAVQNARIASYLDKEKILGIEFVEISRDMDAFLAELLDPKRLGFSLREVPLRPSEGPFTIRWFHGDNAADLFCWQSSGGDFVRHQLVLGGDLVEWSLEEGLRTGEVLRDDFVRVRFSYPVTEPNLIRFHAQKSVKVLQRAEAALGASAIDPAVSESFLKKIWNA